MSVVALLLPLMAAAESHIQTEAPGAASAVTAHVILRIIVPKVLYLRVGGETDRTAGAEKVAIMSNGRSATLYSTDRAPDSKTPARRNVILNASARGTIAQQAQCTPTPTPAGAVPADSRDSTKMSTRSMICTASMP